GTELIDKAGDDAVDDVDNPLPLIRTVVQKLAAHGVDSLALFIHDVVVFKNVLTGSKVLRFHRFLSGSNALCDQARLDRHVFFHAETQHQILHALATKDSKQVVLEGEVKARTAGVALAAG